MLKVISRTGDFKGEIIMHKTVKFAVIGDCHYSLNGNYSTRNCADAKNKLSGIIEKLNNQDLDFIFSLGDLGDGRADTEVPEILDVFAKSRHPVKFAIGNHDLAIRGAEEHAKLIKIPAPMYDFTVKGFRFVVLNPFEISRYSSDEEERELYRKFRKENPWHYVQEWPGLFREESWNAIASILDDAKTKGEQVIFFCHVPVWYLACLREPGVIEPAARIIEHLRMLELLDKYPNVRAFIAGHYHPGGLAVRNGVMHKTVRSLCDWGDETAYCIMTSDDNQIEVQGKGVEKDFVHKYDVAPSYLSGTAPAGCFVMTNCGEIAQVGEDGKFYLKVPTSGKYSIKAVKDKCKDVYLPNLCAPMSDIKINFETDETRKLYTGRIDGYSLLNITDGGNPVRWFDIDGTEYGAHVSGKPECSEHSENFWTNGLYAFTAIGEVSIKRLPVHNEMKNSGWYKGDIHAHLAHGENFYKGNIQQMAFIAQAEGYDWIYVGSDHNNDGTPADSYAIAKKLNKSDFLIKLNEEFPKSKSNHFGNVGVIEPSVKYDMTKVSSLEVAKRFVWERGGITVPVHPFEGDISFKEFPIWINSAPELMPCIDFFYNNNYPKKISEEYWFKLLNRGYKIGCFATSGAAFDAGQTPASKGATYVKLDSLSEESIIKGIKERRTVVSWDCACMIYSIDGYISGDTIEANGQDMNIHLRLFWRSGRTGTLRIVRNGEDVFRENIKFDSDDTEIDISFKISESENSWYVPILETNDGRICSVASPIYFRNKNFVEPEVIPMPKSIPEEFLAELQALTVDELSEFELIDRVASKLKKLEKQ